MPVEVLVMVSIVESVEPHRGYRRPNNGRQREANNTLSSPLRLTSHNSTIDIETQRLNSARGIKSEMVTEILLLLYWGWELDI